jgi:hypothetical protein
VAGTTATFSWAAAADGQTPATGLNYNLRIGTTPGGSQVVAAQSSSLGKRFLPAPGNAGENLTGKVAHLKPGTNYYWSVQAVDTAFAGSRFAPEQSFIARADPPTLQGIVRQGINELRVTWSGTPEVSYPVLTSTDLALWAPLTTLTAGTNGLFSILEVIGPGDARFYRASQP